MSRIAAARHQISGRSGLGFALSLLTTMLWGTLPVALKPLLVSMTPLTVTWYRYVISAVVLTAFLRWRGRLPEFAGLAGLAPLLAAAAVGFAGNNILFLAGLDFVGPSASQVVIQLAPVLLIAAGVFVFGERFGLLQCLGVAVLLGGMGMFFHRGLVAAIVSPGVLLVVVAAVFWVGYAMAQKQLMRSLPALAVLWVVYGSGAVLLLPAAAPAQAHRLDAGGWLLLLYCGVNGTIAYGSFAEAMSHWEVTRVSAVLATTPLFTPIFSELAARLWPARMSSEGLDWLQLAGGVLVAIGSVLTALAQSRPASNTD